MKNNLRRSVILTPEQIREDVKPLVEAAMLDHAKYMFSTKEFFNEDWKVLHNQISFNSWSKAELAEMWAELCSEEFFELNPEVDDVLLLMNKEGTNDIKLCEWLASR
jgi:hypothetical protein